MYCKKCGALLREDAVYCHECGTKIDQSTFTVDNNERTEDLNTHSQTYGSSGSARTKAIKTKQCKACGNEIAKSARECPYCGSRIKAPIYKRPWAIALMVIIILGIVIGGNPKSSSEKNSNTHKVDNTSNASNNTESTEKTKYSVGDVLKDGELKIVYISSGEYQEDNQFMQPKDGYKYIFLKFAFINESKTDRSISFYSFDCFADGYACAMHYAGEEELSATLSSGRSTSGYIYYEVPQNAKSIEIEYTTNYFSSKKITFMFEGEKDSGYKLEPNKNRTEGAYVVGDVISGNNVQISYLSCEPYTSDNMFVQPRAGYHYMTCRLEFENKGTSDKSVSTLSFDCYADGFACDQTYIRDDDLSGTISAGRKINGTVTFEVPDDAEVVELEYNDNIWTSHRIVFVIK